MVFHPFRRRALGRARALLGGGRRAPGRQPGHLLLRPDERAGGPCRHDARHLITVGSLRPSSELGYFFGFKPGAVAAELDFLSVHIYPEKSKIAEAVASVEEFAAAGKPVVIEETSQLYSGVEGFEDFFSQSKALASGWLGFYFGESPEEMNPPADMLEAIRLEWLKLFQELGGQLNE